MAAAAISPGREKVFGRRDPALTGAEQADELSRPLPIQEGSASVCPAHRGHCCRVVCRRRWMTVVRARCQRGAAGSDAEHAESVSPTDRGRVRA